MKERFSYMCSEYHPMFIGMGFPQLDIKQWDDGSWAIREFHRAPVVPAATPWKYVLTGLRNIEISEAFIAKYLWQIDPRTKAFWQKDDDDRKQANDERDYFANEKVERIMRLGKDLSKNEALMERARKIGPEAFDLENIGKQIYRDSPWKLKDLS